MAKKKPVEGENVLDRAIRWFQEATADGTANTWPQQNKAKNRTSIYNMSDEELRARSKKKK